MSDLVFNKREFLYSFFRRDRTLFIRYLSYSFLSNNDLKEIKELFNNMSIKGMDVEDLICHFHQVHIYRKNI